MKHYFVFISIILTLILTGCGSDDQVDNSADKQSAVDHNNDQDSTTTNQPTSDNPSNDGKTDGSDDVDSSDNNDDQDSTDQNTEIDHTADWIGPMEPEDALEYMKTTYPQGLVIVDVTPIEFKLETGFTGSIYIPYTELETRSDEIPANKPVILHCVRGKSSAKAYPILEEKRKDIPVLSYIAGEPLIEEFNTWLASQSENP